MSCDGKWKELQSRQTSHRKTETKHIYVFIEIRELHFRSSLSKDLQKIKQMGSKDKLLNVFLFFCCFVVWNNVHKKSKPVNKKLRVGKCADVNLVFCCPLVMTSYKCKNTPGCFICNLQPFLSFCLSSFLSFFFFLLKKTNTKCSATFWGDMKVVGGCMGAEGWLGRM